VFGAFSVEVVHVVSRFGVDVDGCANDMAVDFWLSRGVACQRLTTVPSQFL
jgi:hypothetical protein